jgi:hypothetical protein
MFFPVQLSLGDDNDQVTEETALNPDSEGGKQLAIVEGLCMATVILKPQYLFWGLIGREIRFGFSRSQTENPDAN